jgi:TonB family protein
MTSMTRHTGYASGRMVVLFAIFAAHILMIYALSNGLGGKVLVLLPDSLVARFIPETRATPEPLRPLLPPKDRLQDRIELVEPVVDLGVSDEAPGDGIVVAAPPGTPAGDAAGVQPPQIVALSYQALRSPDEFYPAQSIRMGEQGVVEIEACVASNGRLDDVPSVRTSSGHARLDAAAVQWAQQALRYRAATSNGVPMRSCKGFRVYFRLNN